jgi:hypothetical protein
MFQRGYGAVNLGFSAENARLEVGKGPELRHFGQKSGGITEF